MIRIAVSTQLWDEELLGEGQLRLVAESGFRALEIFAAPGHFEWQDESYVGRVAAWVRALGLSVCSLHAPWAPGQDIAAIDGAQRRSSVESVKRAVDDLALLDGRILVLHPGATLNRPEHRTRQLGYSRDSIAGISEYCSERGIRIALENPPPYELGGDNRDLVTLYGHFADDPTVQACFDTGHAQLSVEGVSFAGTVPKDILLVHVSDNGGHRDDHRLPDETGTVPWGELFSLLRARGFGGCLMLEVTPPPGVSQILSHGRQWMNGASRELS